MTIETKRNSPCPCGSKKKYKYCCLAKAISITPIEYDIEWQRARQIEGRIAQEAFAFAKEEFGEEMIEEAFREFSLGRNIGEDSPDGKNLFPQWFVFFWIPSSSGSNKWSHLSPNMTIAELYIQKNPNKERQRFITAVIKSPFSFFFVRDVIPARRLILKDLLLDRKITVKEKLAAEPFLKGRLLFGRAISFNKQCILVGVGTASLPLRSSIYALDVKEDILKKENNLTTDSLIQYEHALRATYFDCSEAAHTPEKICNNEGDPIAFCTLHYTFTCSTKKAFDVLASLCQLETTKEILEKGEFDKKNQLIAIDFPWTEDSSTNRVLGYIKIKEDTLIIDVNSIKRSKKIQKEVEKRLSEATFIKIEEKPLGGMLDQLYCSPLRQEKKTRSKIT